MKKLQYKIICTNKRKNKAEWNFRFNLEKSLKKTNSSILRKKKGKINISRSKQAIKDEDSAKSFEEYLEKINE